MQRLNGFQGILTGHARHFCGATGRQSPESIVPAAGSGKGRRFFLTSDDRLFYESSAYAGRKKDEGISKTFCRRILRLF
jgi:hypothetical protein